MESRGKRNVARRGSKRKDGEAEDAVGEDECVKRSRLQELGDRFDSLGKAGREGILGELGEGTSGGSSEGSFEEHCCNLTENCTGRHDSLVPYLWRVKRDLHVNEQWVRLDKENSAIERAFCDPNVEEFWDVESIPGVAVCLHFTTMQAVDLGPIQRLSTPSYVSRQKKCDVTRWQWYWHDASTPQPWNLYGQNNEAPYQDVIEMKFLQDPKQIYRFDLNNETYHLDFTTMEQINLKTNFRRGIRRRPICMEDMKTKRRWTEYHCNSKKLPTGWLPMDTESKSGMELVPLNQDNENYKTISAHFFATMDVKKFEIKQILGVQNLELWTNYQMKKKNMEKFSGQAAEVGLFHGTPKEETVKWICSLGFDQRMNGLHGTNYGKGAYFAKSAICSHYYTQPTGTAGLRSMFYAEVLTGMKVEGNSEYRRPPAIDPNDPKRGLYDTCVDNVANPQIFVVFDNNQSYPSYLIEYQELVIPAAMQCST